mgnify:CR=1 FL=1
MTAAGPAPGDSAAAPEPCTHPDTWFDRTVCAEPCGTMHTICTECGEPLDGLCGQEAADPEPPDMSADRFFDLSLEERYRFLWSRNRDLSAELTAAKRDLDQIPRLRAELARRDTEQELREDLTARLRSWIPDRGSSDPDAVVTASEPLTPDAFHTMALERGYVPNGEPIRLNVEIHRLRAELARAQEIGQAVTELAEVWSNPDSAMGSIMREKSPYWTRLLDDVAAAVAAQSSDPEGGPDGRG